MKFYLDTCIWLDIIEKRGEDGKLGRELIKKIIIENHCLLYSDIVVLELKNIGYEKNEVKKTMSMIKRRNLQLTQATKEQIKKAKAVAHQRNVPLRDVLHAILTRDNDAQLVSRDNHFLKLKDIAVMKSPGEILQGNA